MQLKLKLIQPQEIPEPKPVMRPRACQHCPSTHYRPDLEAMDIRAESKDIRLEHVFACA